MFLMIFLVALCFSKAEVIERLEVICPSLGNEAEKDPSLLPSEKATTYDSTDEYCQCILTVLGTKKTAILKCDFSEEKHIILKGSLFPFKKLNVTSAYVRMRNTLSATVSADFLSSWMDSPSSALDLWQCGNVVIEQTPALHPPQLFNDLKTFVGVGIIDCSLDNLPAFFLRDRNRGAFRLKGCNIGTINAGLFHNIEEVRYMNFENTVVEEVAGPLSSSGVITLSKREIHSWDGIEFINSTFKHIAPFSFNVTHKDIMEKFIVRQSTFGKLEKGAITATGDLYVTVNNCSFSSLDSLAIQISVNGDIAFSNNVIEKHVPDSLLGLSCNKNSVLSNITLYVQSTNNASGTFTKFNEQCGKPDVSYVVVSELAASKQTFSSTTTAATVVVLAVLCALLGLVFWGWKNQTLQRYLYRRNDTPLWKEQRTPDGEEDTSNQESNQNNPSSTVHNPTFANPPRQL